MCEGTFFISHCHCAFLRNQTFLPSRFYLRFSPSSNCAFIKQLFALHREIEFSGASVPARVLFAAVAEVCLLNMIFRRFFPVNRSENEMTQLPEMCLRKTAANDPSTHGTSPARIFIIQPCGAAIKKRLHPE